jgi:predicted alpha/beta hydrolase family esterase
LKNYKKSLILGFGVSMRILIVPGLNGSGPGHWQTLWEEKYGYERVMQRDWENPDISDWVKTLNASIMSHQEQVVIVAHSLGCFAVAQWVQSYPENVSHVQCAMLVAPPDVQSFPEFPETVRRFVPSGAVVLPFPSILVGSENDPYRTAASALRLACEWGSRFVNVGAVGHINLDSGHGPWPEGEALLQNLVTRKH